MENLVIGGLAGVISRTTTAPLELRKIQQQNSHIPNSTLRDVIRLEGITGLWKGNGTNCIRIFPQMAVNYWTYNKVSNYIENVPVAYPFRHFIGGFVSGATAMIATYPFETMRTYLSLQTQRSEYKTPIDVVKKLGPIRIYKGLGTSIMGYGPFNALSFSSYKIYADMFERMDGVNTFFSRILSGGLSGMTALTITYPTDLVRRRIQTQGFLNTPKYNGIFDCVRKIVATEGVPGLYRGLSAAYIKIFPTLAIQFTVLDYLREASQ